MMPLLGYTPTVRRIDSFRIFSISQSPATCQRTHSFYSVLTRCQNNPENWKGFGKPSPVQKACFADVFVKKLGRCSCQPDLSVSVCSSWLPCLLSGRGIQVLQFVWFFPGLFLQQAVKQSLEMRTIFLLFQYSQYITHCHTQGYFNVYCREKNSWLCTYKNSLFAISV